MSAPLPCQQDPYLRTLRTRVVSCAPGTTGHEVVLAESPFFPEGGGQPADHGSVGQQALIGLSRGADGAVVHHLERPLAAGAEVVAEVDWERRYDHMQQHTAQHLITARAQDLLGFETIAFHLSPGRCDVELGCEALAEGALVELEREVNDIVRQARPVRGRWVPAGEIASSGVRTRGLPEGFTGEARLVEIEGVDLNTCGGTHVASTAELQAIKLLGTERLSRGTRLFYLAGARVLRYLGESLQREAAMGKLLSCGPADLPGAVERLGADLRQARRDAKRDQASLARALAEGLAGQQDAVATLTWPEADMGLLRAVAGNLRRTGHPGRWALLVGGEGEGVFVVVGPEEEVPGRAPAAAALLGGRGGGAGGIYQGKASDLGRLAEAAAALAGDEG